MKDWRCSNCIVMFELNWVICVYVCIYWQELVLFLKPTLSYLENGGMIEIPEPKESLDHEVELAVVISQKARDVPEATAMDYVGGVVFFRRNVQLTEFLIQSQKSMLL